jgi:hypothetical protein
MARRQATKRGRIEPVILHEDRRGRVCEPLDPERLPIQRHVHVVVTEPSCVQGHHDHTRGTAVITVPGLARVRIRDARGIWDTIIAEGAAIRCMMPPGVAPAMQTLGRRSTRLVAFRDRADDPAALDVVREVLIEV